MGIQVRAIKALLLERKDTWQKDGNTGATIWLAINQDHAVMAANNSKYGRHPEPATELDAKKGHTCN